MAFYVEVFDKNNKEDFIGYVGFNQDDGSIQIVDSIAYALMFTDPKKFMIDFNMNGQECGEYFFNFCWNGHDEDPKKYFKKNIREENISKKLTKEVKKSNKIKENIETKGRKRLDYLPQYVRWDVCNTVRCKRNIFTCLIYRDGKVTSTSSFTVYEAMLKVVENHTECGKMTMEEALKYLATYSPEMEKGFTIRKALSRSKVNQ